MTETLATQATLVIDSARSFKNIENNLGPNTEPLANPNLTVLVSDLYPEI